jgi:hypothetical protein
VRKGEGSATDVLVVSGPFRNKIQQILSFFHMEVCLREHLLGQCQFFSTLLNFRLKMSISHGMKGPNMRNLARAVTALSALPLLSAVMACAGPLTYDFISKKSIPFALPASPAPTSVTLNSFVVASSPLILNGGQPTENVDISTLTAGREAENPTLTIAQFMTSVPEPSSLALLGTGMLDIGLCFALNRKFSPTKN